MGLARSARAHQAPFCARELLKTGAVSENAPGAHRDVPRDGECSTDGCANEIAQVAAETPEQAHTWQGWVPQRTMQGRWTVQVAAETQETAHTWKRRVPQRAMLGMWTAQVTAETPE